MGNTTPSATAAAMAALRARGFADDVVRVLDHRAVAIDGRLAKAGEEIKVSAVDAKALTDEGYVEAVKPAREPVTTRPRDGTDGVRRLRENHHRR